jgi:catechol 2,3-dioxygenase-like lactoylglutathione lyase family enzyme
MTAPNLSTVEVKAFIPARDFALSKRFYQALGFMLASDSDGVAYFHHGACSFLLQNFHGPEFADNLMMHLLVQNVDDWYAHVQAQRIAEQFQVRIDAPVNQPWAMRDFVLFDPSGVLWRIAQNLPR